ncbi:hypothetical protein HN014_08100 [Aquimarina sp. TRL1]|uniref:hypothetical protein n=1 Tax=Aquimarina sp. (strain TRL1) TaxID=2736252 RepID=UPI00158A8974|nr:hypothetical protein [Aquimarina sp. TRL1]QKX04880.1 hypothetical protein HN014_08100 [Aquimarina sp. TRL1]
MALQTEVWEADLKENPIPDTSFVYQSEEKSEYVNNNTLHLQEAGIEPTVYENFFAADPDAELPIMAVDDIPHEVLLSTYSTAVTRHRKLEEVELSYGRRQSVINRHRNALAKQLGRKAAYMWTPGEGNEFNSKMDLAANDSIIDAITDLRAFYMDHDINEDLNLCLNAGHWARIKKEDKKLYKELIAEKNKIYCDFKIFTYSQTPVFTETGIKKPYGAVPLAGDRRSSFSWVSSETFRCFGDTEAFLEEKKAKTQADLLSYAQRGLVGNIRANNPKYLGAII